MKSARQSDALTGRHRTESGERDCRGAAAAASEATATGPTASTRPLNWLPRQRDALIC